MPQKNAFNMKEKKGDGGKGVQNDYFLFLRFQLFAGLSEAYGNERDRHQGEFMTNVFIIPTIEQSSALHG